MILPPIDETPKKNRIITGFRLGRGKQGGGCLEGEIGGGLGLVVSWDCINFLCLSVMIL